MSRAAFCGALHEADLELLQFDGPVGVVEELFPASVASAAEVDVYEGVAFWFYGSCDEGHTGLLGGFAAFFYVAFGAGADDIFPDGSAAHAFGDDVVEGEFFGGVFFAAVLAGVPVASEDVPAVEFDVLCSGQVVVEEQADDARDGDIEVDG